MQWIELLKNSTRFGPKGTVTQVSEPVAKQLIEDRFAKAVDGPKRARKRAKPENKALSAEQ